MKIKHCLHEFKMKARFLLVVSAINMKGKWNSSSRWGIGQITPNFIHTSSQAQFLHLRTSVCSNFWHYLSNLPPTVLCKSNANEFLRISRGISQNFLRKVSLSNDNYFDQHFREEQTKNPYFENSKKREFTRQLTNECHTK